MAKQVSEVQDGFALKRQRDKGQKRKVKGECTIPPPPVKHILSSYTMSNPISKRAVSDYVEIQAREKVQHAERVMTEHVLGHDHDCWDVHTNKDRYWVITSPTNLYSQHYFPSLITLSWIQDWSVKYPSGENIALIPAEGGAPQNVLARFLVG
jgi:hypothetical protein